MLRREEAGRPDVEPPETTGPAPGEQNRTGHQVAIFWVSAVGIAALAVVVRANLLLGRAGIYGLGNYDDGVHYATAVGLVNGLWPYRDFLFLHPPGIAVALIPFAWIGELSSDPAGMAVSRVAWWLLGGINTLLIMRLLRPLGMFGALFGGLWYALFVIAAYSEWTPLLEGLSATCMLGAFLVARVLQGVTAAGPLRLAIAGALVGFSASIKIWGVLLVLVLVGWYFVSGERRRSGVFLAGSVAGCAVACLPFFLWRRHSPSSSGWAASSCTGCWRIAQPGVRR